MVGNLKRNKFKYLLLILYVFILSCEKTFFIDTSCPEVRLISPTAGQVLTETTKLIAEATDDNAILKVEFYFDGEFLAVVEKYPYEHNLNVAFWADGKEHTVLAKAYDKSFNIGYSEVIYVTITENAGTIPYLLEPPCDDSVSNLTPFDFKWNTVLNATRYWFKVYSDTLGVNVHIDTTVFDTCIHFQSFSNGDFSWKVAALNESGGCSSYSSLFRFYTERPFLLTPADGEILNSFIIPFNVEFSWEGYSGADFFEILIASDDNFVSVVDSERVESEYISISLPNDGEYYWKLRAGNYDGVFTKYSETHRFEIQAGKVFGGTSYDRFNAISETSDGGYILVGSSNSFSSSFDVWIVKLDSEGNELWCTLFGGYDHDYAYSVQETYDNGFIVAGSYYDDALLLKLDAFGNEEWFQSYGGDDGESFYSVLEADDNGFIVAGYSYSYGVDQKEMYLVKTDIEGNELWYKTFGGTYDEYAKTVIQTIDGDYIISGLVSNPAGIRLIKIDNEGNEIWDKIYSIDSYHMFLYTMKHTSDGGWIIPIVYSVGDLNFKCALYKFDSSGNEEWSKIVGETTAYYTTLDVDQTDDDGFIIVYTIDEFNSGNDDILLVKTDPSCNEQWSQSFGGNQHERAKFVIQATDGSYVFGGDKQSCGWVVKYFR